MLGAGADGVMQAMVLSIGALKFSNQHLEFGMEPKDMHRDYVFRWASGPECELLFSRNDHRCRCALKLL